MARAAAKKSSKIPAEKLELYEKLVAAVPDSLFRDTKVLQGYLEISLASVKTLKPK
jgi:hypothetical protein